jgi:hypothetical protein
MEMFYVIGLKKNQSTRRELQYGITSNVKRSNRKVK